MNAKTNSGFFLQQPCSWVVAAACLKLRAQRQLLVGESMRPGPVRVWISQSVKYFGDSMFDLKVDKSPRQVDVSVQWSRVFKHQLAVPWSWRLYNDSLCKHIEGSLGITRYCRATFRKFSEAAGIKGTSPVQAVSTGGRLNCNHCHLLHLSCVQKCFNSVQLHAQSWNCAHRIS